MIFDPILDIFRGKAVTIPPMDGALRPNTALDDADVAASLSEPDNLVVFDGQLIASSGNAIYRVGGGADPSVLKTFAARISALAVSTDGELAVALEPSGLLVGDKEIELPADICCITALVYGADSSLYLANGSIDTSPALWSQDLMAKGRSGSIWVLERGASSFRKIAGGLAYANGLLVDGKDLIVSESWRHRLVRIDIKSGGMMPVAGNLPGYPGRLSPTEKGALLSIFAPMNRLIEFVLQETQYRKAMMRDIPVESWIAPSLSSGRSFLEPLQCGGIKTMGIHKPWSPSRSYGLVVQLDAAMQPVSSLHSRANGSRHGITSALVFDGSIYAASKGGDAILVVPHGEFR